MAISDICEELKKDDVRIDATMEGRICEAIFKRLQVETMNDVQSISVKCLSILVGREGVTQVSNICKELGYHILNGKSELRDIYALGLKTLIKDVPSKFGTDIAECLISQKDKRSKTNMLEGMRKEALDIKSESMDIVNDLLTRFGPQMKAEHEAIMNICLDHLTHSETSIRKRASNCIGSIAISLNDELLRSLIENTDRGLLTMLKKISSKSGSKGKDVTIIQTIGSVSRNVGYRLGPFLKSLLPVFLDYCKPPSDDEDDDGRDQVNEVRENCLYAIESFVMRCPQEVSDALDGIIELVLSFARYDPNYNNDEDDEDGEEEEEEEDEDDDNYYSDDDDNSWKVRRAAIKVLSAAIAYHPTRLASFYEKCSEKLIKRFKEREEGVRLEVIQCFTALIKATVVEIEKTTSLTDTPSGPPKLMRMRSCKDQFYEGKHSFHLSSFFLSPDVSLFTPLLPMSPSSLPLPPPQTMQSFLK
jgi:cullin-associated NEDD8-dissociated protein 1